MLLADRIRPGTRKPIFVARRSAKADLDVSVSVSKTARCSRPSYLRPVDEITSLSISSWARPAMHPIESPASAVKLPLIVPLPYGPNFLPRFVWKIS